MALITGLPSESTSSCILRDVPEQAGWGTTNTLLAEVINSVRDNTHTNVQVRTKKKIPEFPRINIPGSEEEKAEKKKTPNLFVRMAQAQFNRED